MVTETLDIETVNQSSVMPDFLDNIVNDIQIVRRDSERESVKGQLQVFMSEVDSGAVVIENDLINAIELRIAAIDEMLSEQMSSILHHPDFQELESSWRGLYDLVSQSNSENTKFRLLNCSKKELSKDFRQSLDFDYSSLFKVVYESEYGTFGGEPFSALIGDFSFDNTPEDIQLLEEISHVAAAAHAPFFSSASPGMLSLDNYSELFRPREFSKVFQTTDYARWNAFRSQDDSRYVGLTLPKVIGRLPYKSQTTSVESFNFDERIDEDDRNYLWINAAYKLGERLVDAFENYGWCAAIRGVEGGGLVESLPIFNYDSRSGERVMQCPTEVAISDRREKELSDLGFIPLVYCKGTDYAAFFAVQSINKPKKYDMDIANANAKLSSQLPYILTTSRFAHYMKAIVRDKVGSFMSSSECQNFLQTWINQYVVGSDDVGPTIKASHPLREAKVEVVDIPGSPGKYRAIAYLRPHFQLEGLSMSLRLVAELPISANR